MATILSTVSTSTYFWTGGDLTIAGAGGISDSGSIGLDIPGAVGTFINNGAINATWAIENSSTVAGSLVNNGSITGGWGLINGFNGQAGYITSFVNNGTMTGSNYGVLNSSGSSIGDLENAGTLSTSVENYGAIGTFDNSGTLIQGIRLYGSGASITSLVNSGTIGGNLSLSNGATISTITNTGTISTGFDNSGSTLSATIITNSGTIAGSITLSPNADVLNIQGGAIEGDIIATSPGHGTVNIEVGAGKTYVSQGDLGGGSGFALGTINLDSGALSVDFSKLDATTLDFAGNRTVLVLTGSGETLNATIAGFAGGDAIDLVHVSATSVSLTANDQLVAMNSGTNVATLQLSGKYGGATFSIIDDGAGGSDIEVTYTAANAVKYESLNGGVLAVVDTWQNVLPSLDEMQALARDGRLDSIVVTNAAATTMTVTAPQVVTDLGALEAISGNQGVAVTDTAANVSTAIDSLEVLLDSGKLSAITLSDVGIPGLVMTSSQAVTDAQAIAAIRGTFMVTQTVGIGNLTIDAVPSALGNAVQFSGDASQYSIASDNDGFGLTVSTIGSVYKLSGIQALHFNDISDIVAQAPGNGTVTSGNIAELYGAVFARVPDVAGLAYYENMAKANPNLPLTSFAQMFLASPEYTQNVTHSYAPTITGETQFITDLYQNLLKRAPESGAVQYYLGIIGQLAPGAAPGANAEAFAHAVVVADISASTEFLNDVSVTAQNPSNAQHWLVLI